METYIIDFITNYGYLAVFLLILLENIFPPIPSEVVLTFAGFMTTSTALSIVGVVAVATLGSYFGAIVLYAIGFLLQPQKFASLMQKKWMQKIGFKMENIERAQSWFVDHGKGTVFLCRLIPVIRSLISLPAGMAKMNFIVFSLWSLLGTLLWNTILVFVGVLLGNNWNAISGYMQEYAFFIILALLLVTSIYVWLKRKT